MTKKNKKSESPAVENEEEENPYLEEEPDLRELFKKMSLSTNRTTENNNLFFSPKEREIIGSMLPSVYTFSDLEEGDVDGATATLLVAFDLIPSLFKEIPLLFMDSSRRKYLRQFAKKLLYAEKQGYLANEFGAQHVCELVLGTKGIGKTTFFQCLTIATALVTKNVFPIWVDHSKDSRTFSEFVSDLKLVKGDNTPSENESSIAIIQRKLGQQKKVVLFIGDEFHMVYKRKNGLPIVEEFNTIGMSNRGTVWAILSGSSPYLRNLAYCKGDLKAMQVNFPGYTGTCSLNNERYQVRKLYPISERDEFEKCLKFVLPDEEWNDEMINSWYVSTGGVYRRLGSKENERDRGEEDEDNVIAHQLEGILNRQNFPYCKEIWNALLEKHQTSPVLSPFDLPSIFIPEGIPPEAVFDLADKGCIRIDFEDYTEKISFLLPLQLEFWKHHRSNETLSFEEVVCLLYPFGQLGIQAESLLTSSLKEKGFFGLGETKVEVERVSDLPLSMADFTVAHTLRKHLKEEVAIFASEAKERQLKKGRRIQISATFHNSFSALENVIFKEYPDHFGSDFDIIRSDYVHRVQLKLGRSALTNNDVEEICGKLKEGNERMAKVFRQSDIPELKTLKSKLYLATTRPLNEDQRKILQDEGVFLLDREALYDLWKPSIQEWAKKVGDPTYVKLDDVKNEQ